MANRWIRWVTVAQFTFVALCMGTALWLSAGEERGQKSDPLPPPSLPCCAFSPPSGDYEVIGAPLLHLKRAPLSVRLPDLKRHLIYFGRNGRPDADPVKSQLHFAFNGNKGVAAVLPQQRLYLTYDKKLTPPQYIFSPNNSPTSLWIEAHAEGNQAVVRVGGTDKKGKLLTEPKANALFTLAEKEYGRMSPGQWELEGQRVDGTLLVRQKARWYGRDLFIDEHGGDEYSHLQGKQRIDFGEGENSYSIFIGSDDVMVWKKGRWYVVKPGEESKGLPLALIKKTEERLLTLEMWDAEGKTKIMLNLLKATEAFPSQLIPQTFKYIGPRTRQQFIFEVQRERMLLSPNDWLLYTDGKWRKLTRPEEIDDYVDRHLKGMLLIFEGMDKREGSPAMIAKMFNSARNEEQNLEVLFQGTTGTAVTDTKKKKNEGKGLGANGDDEDDGDDDDGDDDDDEDTEDGDDME